VSFRKAEKSHIFLTALRVVCLRTGLSFPPCCGCVRYSTTPSAWRSCKIRCPFWQALKHVPFLYIYLLSLSRATCFLETRMSQGYIPSPILVLEVSFSCALECFPFSLFQFPLYMPFTCFFELVRWVFGFCDFSGGSGCFFALSCLFSVTLFSGRRLGRNSPFLLPAIRELTLTLY